MNKKLLSFFAAAFAFAAYPLFASEEAEAQKPVVIEEAAPVEEAVAPAEEVAAPANEVSPSAE